MNVVAVIPARGGSKGIPRKNLQIVGGRSLIRRAVETYSNVTAIDHTVVTTDDRDIAAEAAAAGAIVVDRPSALADDRAGSEPAVLHALTTVDATRHAGVVVFGQCTSPFVDRQAVDRAVRRVRHGEHDVVFAAVPSHGFLWKPSQLQAAGTVEGVNHDPSARLRRQDRPREFRETGAFYAMRRDGLDAVRHRFFGRVGVELVEPWTAIEIDDHDDLVLARAIARSRGEPADVPPTPYVGRVDVLVTDFDGVHTDNRVRVDQFGQEAVVVDRGDGLGVAMLRAAGVGVLILSTERNHVVSQRAEKLGVDCIAGCDDKWPALDRWLTEHGHDLSRVMYLGNDQNDVDCLIRVGWPVVVADAHPSVRHFAAFETTAPGGRGAVREVADLILANRPTTSTTATNTRRLIDATTG